MKKKLFLTTIIVTTLGFVEWKMWHFFRHEFKAYNPSDEVIAATFIGWMFLGAIFAAMACLLLAKLYTPKNERGANS